MKFVVSECNRLTRNRSYARIHRAICGHAREPNHKTASTLCHGYFDEYFEALDFAESLNVDRVYDCAFCSPRHERTRAKTTEKGVKKRLKKRRRKTRRK